MQQDSEQPLPGRTTPDISHEGTVPGTHTPVSLGEPGRIETSPHIVALLAVVAVVILADLTLYRSSGFFGPAVFLPIATGILCAVLPNRGFRCSLLVTTLLLIIVAVRLAWSGSSSQIVTGLWLMSAVVMARQDMTPYFLESIAFLGTMIPAGFEFFQDYGRIGHRRLFRHSQTGRPSRMLSILMPVGSVLAFSVIFLMANPDIVSVVSKELIAVIESVRAWLFRMSLLELPFWIAVAWAAGGMLRQQIHHRNESAANARPANDMSEVEFCGQVPATAEHTTATGLLLNAFRNTLVTLNALFAGYLAFEFQTLWFREFPERFHYSGYAHQGAAWLTIALALATVTLSLMFRGALMFDLRIRTLRRLAMVWSVLNLLLAASVYNRLLIYIDFNGMTRMRVIGLLGISAVVGGFLLVVWKINHVRNFLWLIRRQLWVAAFAAFVYIVIPVDLIIHRYNVNEILAGNSAPSVQISQHEIDDYALSALIPLLDTDDAVIRNGVTAMLSSRRQQLHWRQDKRQRQGWTARQFAAGSVLRKLDARAKDFEAFHDTDQVDRALSDFSNYSMQWW